MLVKGSFLVGEKSLEVVLVQLGILVLEGEGVFLFTNLDLQALHHGFGSFVFRLFGFERVLQLRQLSLLVIQVLGRSVQLGGCLFGP